MHAQTGEPAGLPQAARCTHRCRLAAAGSGSLAEEGEEERARFSLCFFSFLCFLSFLCFFSFLLPPASCFSSLTCEAGRRVSDSGAPAEQAPVGSLPGRSTAGWQPPAHAHCQYCFPKTHAH